MNSVGGYQIGDRVYCLAWIGKAFDIVAIDAATDKISLRGELASDPNGALIDIFPSTMWMLTHNVWEDIWHWPDRAGEHFDVVFDRFTKKFQPADVVTAYLVEGKNIWASLGPDPDTAMAFRLVSMADGVILVQPVIGLDANGRPTIRDATSAIAASWIEAGPIVPARLGMIAYRWCIAFGNLALNAYDFVGVD